MSKRALILTALALTACSAPQSGLVNVGADASVEAAAPDAADPGTRTPGNTTPESPDAPGPATPDAATTSATGDAATPAPEAAMSTPDAAPPDATPAPDAAAPDATPDATARDTAAADLTPIDPGLVNVAPGGTASASAVWENNPILAPEKVIDGSSYDAPMGGNYWTLPNETTGWWQVDLKKTVDIALVRILNCNNGGANDRATKDFRLQIKDELGQVVYSTAGVLPFTSASSADNPTRPYDVRLEKPVAGRTVRIFVDSWYPTRTDPTWPYPVIDSSDEHNQGGGLDEVLVFARVLR